MVKGSSRLVQRLRDGPGGGAIGILIALLLAGLMALTLYGGGMIGAVDFGIYDTVLPECGLRRTYRDTQNIQQIYFQGLTEEFLYDDLPILNLLQINPASSIVYPVTLVRLVTQPFGAYFYTAALAFIYLLVCALAFWLLFRAVYAVAPSWTPHIALVCALLCVGSSHTGWFNSLYREGCLYAFGLLYIGLTARALTARPGGGLRIALPQWIGTLLFSLSMPQAFVLMPPLVALSALLAWRHRTRQGRLRRILYGAAALVLLGITVRSSSLLFLRDETLFSSASNYYAVFQGVLYENDSAELHAVELGLPPEAAQDVGKSLFLNEEDYSVSPHGEAGYLAVLSKLGPGKVLDFYARHPGQLAAMLDYALVRSPYYDNSRLVLQGESMQQDYGQVYRMTLWGRFRQTLFPSVTAYYLTFGALFALSAALTALWRLPFALRGAGIALMGLCIGALILPILQVVCLGLNEVYHHAYVLKTVSDLSLLSGALIAGCAAQGLARSKGRDARVTDPAGAAQNGRD